MPAAMHFRTKEKRGEGGGLRFVKRPNFSTFLDALASLEPSQEKERCKVKKMKHVTFGEWLTKKLLFFWSAKKFHFGGVRERGV